MKHNISARGILERNNKILFAEYKDTRGILYALPGGSQNTGEDLRSTLKREFKEETNLDIESHEVVIVREFIIDSSEFDVWKNGIHQVEIIFRCTQKNKEQAAVPGELQDQGMLGIRWISNEEMKFLRIYPANNLYDILKSKEITYLFDKE
ncbi:MAG: NUDIX domain-containing protein [bacterium]